MQAVGSFVLPKNGVYHQFLQQREFPSRRDPFTRLLAARGDLDRAAAHRDRIETSARGFLENDATSCVDGAVCTVKSRAEVYADQQTELFQSRKACLYHLVEKLCQKFQSLIFLLNYILVLFAFVDGHILPAPPLMVSSPFSASKILSASLPISKSS